MVKMGTRILALCIVSILACGDFTTGQGCYEEKLKDCFIGMASALGIPSDQMSANIIFALINPGVSNEVQNRTCSALKGFDYSSIKPCIMLNGCTQTTVWTPEIASISGLPVLTWMTLVELLQSFCTPGCSNYERVSNATTKCGQNIASNNNDQCLVMKQAVQCYRNAVGQCEVSAVFTESSLDHVGFIDLVQQFCPGINVELYVGPSQTTTTVSSQGCNKVWSSESNKIIVGSDDRQFFGYTFEKCKTDCIENNVLPNCASIEYNSALPECRLSLKKKSDITDPTLIQPSPDYIYHEWSCNNPVTTTSTTSTTTKPTTTTTTTTTTTNVPTTTTSTTTSTTTTKPTTTTTATTTTTPTTTTTTVPTTTTTTKSTTATGGWITFSKPTTTPSTNPASTTTTSTQRTATTTTTQKQPTTTPTQPTTTPTTTTTTTLPPEVTAHVQVKFNGSYAELIGSNTKAWETHAKPQIAQAAEVNDTRIEKVKLSPGSIQLDFNILPSQRQGDTPVMVAVDNVHKKVANGQFVLQGPNSSSTIPYINNSFKYWNVTAQQATPAPAKSTGIFAIGKVYIVLIALGILIVLLLFTAIALILMRKRKDESRSHGDGGELYDEEVDPPSSNGPATLNGRKNDAADVENVDTFNY